MQEMKLKHVDIEEDCMISAVVWAVQESALERWEARRGVVRQAVVR